jgi:flagellar protein FlbT
MSLRLQLKPHEKCIVGGAAIQNGDKPTSFIVANQTTILREKHILTEETANTLAKQIYFVVQMIYIDGGIDESKHKHGAFFELIKEFVNYYPKEGVLELVANIGNDLLEGKCYSALKKCGDLIQVETDYANVA